VGRIRKRQNAGGSSSGRSVGGAVASLPSWLRAYIDTLGKFAQGLTPMVGAIWGTVLTILPFLPLVLLFYVIDAGYASINAGSIQPMGVCVSTLYGLVGVIVGIANTIYSFIKFW